MLRVRDPREAIVFVAIRNWTPFTLNFSADRSLAALDQLISTILSFAFHFARETAGMLVALTISIDSVRANVFSSLERGCSLRRLSDFLDATSFRLSSFLFSQRLSPDLRI